MNTDADLTQKIKSFARAEGADLVGIASMSRWDKAPLEHSPRGVFPKAASVVVCAIHIPDACVELAQEDDPRKAGPALAQANVSGGLNRLGFRVARFLEQQGWPSLCVPVTGFWRYRPSPGNERGWIGDICSYYAAACAGLGEIGWHNLCITPEFGSRQRFICIITEAPLAQDPMYSGPPLCDKCMLCAKHCPLHSFDKELSGMLEIEIENRKFTFPNRNLWRCAIGENFQIDMLMPWPEKVDEKVVTERLEEAVTEHPEWIYGWNMGHCLKWCMSPARRWFDKKYCKAPRRRRDMTPDDNPETAKRILSESMRMAHENDADFFVTLALEDMTSWGMDPRQAMPDALGSILLGFGHPEGVTGADTRWTELLIARHVEKYGYSAMIQSEKITPEDAAVACGLAKKTADGRIVTDRFADRQVFRLILVGMPLKTDVNQAMPVRPAPPSPALLTSQIRRLALSEGADLVGVASAGRLDRMAAALDPAFAGQDGYFVVEDQGWSARGISVWGSQGMPYNPKSRPCTVTPKRPSDHLPGAKAAIVIGLAIPSGSVENAGTGPGAKAAHYSMSAHSMTVNQGALTAYKVAKFLDRFGYRARITFDIEGLAGGVFSGYDLLGNRFAAVAAGLAEIGWSGAALTPQYGPRQRFVAVITDAPLAEDPLYTGAALCKRCMRCVSGCPANAISKTESVCVEVDGKRLEWGKAARLRCDWAKRYGLLTEAGPKYLGATTDFPIPDEITPEAVCEAMRGYDRLQRPGYTAIMERCITECSAGALR